MSPHIAKRMPLTPEFQKDFAALRSTRTSGVSSNQDLMGNGYHESHVEHTRPQKTKHGSKITINTCGACGTALRRLGEEWVEQNKHGWLASSQYVLPSIYHLDGLSVQILYLVRIQLACWFFYHKYCTKINMGHTLVLSLIHI